MLIRREKSIVIEVYYAEDDEIIAKSVKEYLEQQNCKVTVFGAIVDIKKALINHLLPLFYWIGICRTVKETIVPLDSEIDGTNLPVIYLTVRGDSCDIVSGFQNGADDYVVKPFDLAVLHSRILALLRRAKGTKAVKLSCDDLILYKEKAAVYYQQKEVAVSQSEYQLLLLLLENKGKTVTRRQLLEQIWDNSGNYVNDNTLTVTMKRLREKLNHPLCLKTIRSFGYRMEDTK